MKTAGARISDQEYEALKEYANSQGSNVNAILGKLARETIGGSIKPKLTKDSSGGVRGRIPYCPKCGFILSFNFKSSEWGCLSCGYFFYVQAPVWQRGQAIKI